MEKITENKIIDSNNYFYIYKFYSEIKGANKDRLKKKLLEVQTEVELSIIDYKEREDKPLDTMIYINLVEEVLGVRLPNFTMAFNLIKENLFEIIEKIGLVHLYLKLNNRYFKVKEEVMERIDSNNQDLLSIYEPFLKGNMGLELALELDKKYLIRNNKKELKKVH